MSIRSDYAPGEVVESIHMTLLDMDGDGEEVLHLRGIFYVTMLDPGRVMLVIENNCGYLRVMLLESGTLGYLHSRYVSEYC